MKVTVIGSSNTDMIIKAPRIPMAGEIVLGGPFSIAAGGKGANQAVAAARAGGDVSFIGRIGNDIFGEQALKSLTNDHVNVNYVIRDALTASGIATIVVADNGESSIAVAPGANLNISVEDVSRAQDIILSSDILLLQLEIPLDTVKYAVKLAYSKGIRVILNPAPALPISDELLKSISVLTPDAGEAEKLTGIHITDDRSAELAGRILLERGLDRVIITMHAKGAMVIDNGGAEHVPGFKVKAVDNTAVNDVFNGTLAVALAEGKNFYESVLFANAAAAIAVTRWGAQPSIPYHNEILEMLKNSKRSH